MKKIYLDELEDKGKEIISYSKNDIASKIEEMKLLTNNFIWDGIGYNSYIEEYNKVINKLEILNNNLTTIANFLLMAKDSYSESNSKIENAYNELLDEFAKIERI